MSLSQVPEKNTSPTVLGTSGAGQDQKPNKAGSSALGWGIAIAVFVLIIIVSGIHYGFGSTFFSLVTLLEVIALFNILIIVHELGHFLAAKWCGLKIEKFAIWFGNPLWSKKVDGVEYILGSIPAGGYVALPQMAPMEALEGKSDTPREELPPASPWQKIIVAFAGPLFSFGLALFFACIVWCVGKPVSYSEATTIVGFVIPNNPAEKAGLLPGDKIISIDGHSIARFFGVGDSVVWRIISSTADTIPVVVQRGADLKTIDVTPERDPEHDHAWYQRSPTRKIGVAPAMESLIIKKILPDSPALLAGLQPGDQITAMNGAPIYSTTALWYQLKDHPKDAIKFDVLRLGKTQTISVLPERPIAPQPMPVEGPQVDIGIDEWDNSIKVVYLTPFQQVRESVEAVTGTLSALFAPRSNVGASQLSGPVGIMRLFYEILSGPYGWQMALWFAVLINVNLAMLNMFPLPVLDGGHITLAIIEWIRRRPLSMAILEPLQTACALLLIGYMAYVSFFDVQDAGRDALSSGGEIKFAPKTTAP